MATLIFNTYFQYNGVDYMQNNAFSLGQSDLFIMKGTMPDQTTFVGYTSPSANRASDILIQFLLTSAYRVDNRNTPGTPSYYICADVTDRIASASGTATWFWLQSTSFLGQPKIAGTITTIDNGTGDLLVTNTSINSGSAYRLGTFRWALPLTYNF